MLSVGSAKDIFKGLSSGDIRSLSRAITIIESQRLSDIELAEDLILMASEVKAQSHRIAITGVPGVGKSTFIDALGMQMLEQGKRVAVLAIDPSSSLTAGSILGDKTRMATLSRDTRAYIRPSSTARTLGGIARKTREAMMLCEAAGFDSILVETVGVGQSEVAVRSMVDSFVLLMLAGAGDELQGIKRGIMEMADVLLVNKAETANIGLARSAASDYRTALHMLSSNNDWSCKVGLMSALEGTGLAEALAHIESHKAYLDSEGRLAQQRSAQYIEWFEESLNAQLLDRFYADSRHQEAIEEARSSILDGEENPLVAARRIIRG